MGLFGKKASVAPLRPAVRRVTAGDGFWHHGRGFTIVAVGASGRVLAKRGDGMKVFTTTNQLRWNLNIERWVMPGTEGPMPKTVRGQEVLPPSPTCPCCGFRTLRYVPCELCRDLEKAEQIGGAHLEATRKRVATLQARRWARLKVIEANPTEAQKKLAFRAIDQGG